MTTYVPATPPAVAADRVPVPNSHQTLPSKGLHKKTVSAISVVAGYGSGFVANDPSHPLYVGPPTITRNVQATIDKHQAKAARRAAKAQRLVAEGKL